MPDFSRGVASVPKKPSFFEAALLPDVMKLQLCQDLLAEIGARNVRSPTTHGEIVHSCPIPSGHRNGDSNPSASLNYKRLTFNCLTGDTLVKTFDGEFPIKELAGRTVLVLDGNGKWVKAPIKHYGRDRVYRVTLSRNGVRKVVETTGEHRWYTRAKGSYSRGKGTDLIEKTTVTLKPKDRIPSVWPMVRTGRATLSPVGIMAGFVYGDGSRTEYGGVANFCGPKDEAMLPYFSGFEVLDYPKLALRKIVAGLPRSWKDLPSLDEGTSYLYGWLAGYFAADGCVAEDGHTTLSCASEDVLRTVVAICDRLGIATYTLNSRDREGISGELSSISSLSFRNSTLVEKFFLIPEHQQRFLAARERRTYERTHWWVSSVEETDRIEDVYCAEVSTTQSFVLANNILTGNCLGCGAQGGLLWFIAVTQGLEAEQAFKWLGEQTGVGGRSMDGQRVIEILEAIFNQQEDRSEPINIYPDSALDPWTHPWVHPYLTDHGRIGRIKCRGIPEENCRQFKVGYAEKYPMGWERDEDGELILDASGEMIPLPPEERIVIPVFWDGRLVGWQARALDPDSPVKYKSSPQFPRDRVLYGWEPDRDIVLVESPMSVLRHCHHQPMVASFGKQLTDAQVRILQRARSITLWFDPDDAGWKGTRRAIDELRAYLPIRVVDWRYRDTDPADLPDHVVDERVSGAMPWPLWRRPGYENLRTWKG